MADRGRTKGGRDGWEGMQEMCIVELMWGMIIVEPRRVFERGRMMVTNGGSRARKSYWKPWWGSRMIDPSSLKIIRCLGAFSSLASNIMCVKIERIAILTDIVMSHEKGFYFLQ